MQAEQEHSEAETDHQTLTKTQTKTRQLHLLVAKDAYQQLRLTAFPQHRAMAEIVTRGIAHILAFTPQTPSPVKR